MDSLNMENLQSNSPFTFDPHPFYNTEIFPNYTNFMNSYLHRGELNPPMGMQTMGLISELTPKIHKLNVHGNIGDALPHIPSKVGLKNKNNFHVNVDVWQYAPEELSVKIVDDYLVIEGKHDEREADDIGYVSRHFVRRYELPKSCNSDAIFSKLSTNGVLTVLIPKSKDKSKERIVPIQIADANDVSVMFDKADTESDEENEEDEE